MIVVVVGLIWLFVSLTLFWDAVCVLSMWYWFVLFVCLLCLDCCFDCIVGYFVFCVLY